MPHTPSSSASRVRTRPEIEAPVADVGLAPSGVDAQVADLDGAGALGCHFGPTKDRFDPRHEGSRIEGLGHVIVRPELQADDRVDILGARGQHQDRHVAAAAKLPADLEAVHLGQHQVQHHQVRVAALVLGQGLLAVAGGHDRVALLLQV